eukprot:903837_1
MSPVRMGVLLPDFECSVNLFVIRSFGDERSLKEEKLTRNEEETIPRFTDYGPKRDEEQGIKDLGHVELGHVDVFEKEFDEAMDNVLRVAQMDLETNLSNVRKEYTCDNDEACDVDPLVIALGVSQDTQIKVKRKERLLVVIDIPTGFVPFMKT